MLLVTYCFRALVSAWTPSTFSTSRALSYNMIENNFCTSDHWWTEFFHFDQRTMTGNTCCCTWRAKMTKETRVTGRSPGQAEETGLLYRVFFWLMFSHWIIRWMNSGAGWLFNGTLRNVMSWFSQSLGSTLRSRTTPLFPRGPPFTTRTGQ